MKTRSFLSALVAVQALAAFSTQAAIVYSGLKDFVITNDFSDLYLDVDAGTLVGAEAPGWDINFFFGGEGIGNSPAFQPVRISTAPDSKLVNLAPGATVGPSSVFGTGFNGSLTHVGNSPGKFNSGVEGYLGFRFTTNASAGPYYGWMRVVLSNTGSTGLIRDWAYDDTGSLVVIPEVSYATLPLICAGSMLLRRRRK